MKPAEAIVFSQASIHNNKKRRATEIIQNEVTKIKRRKYLLIFYSVKVPLAERLRAFESQSSANTTSNDKKQNNLSADTQVTLLTQGLQSSDATLLDVC